MILLENNELKIKYFPDGTFKMNIDEDFNNHDKIEITWLFESKTPTNIVAKKILHLVGNSISDALPKNEDLTETLFKNAEILETRVSEILIENTVKNEEMILYFLVNKLYETYPHLKNNIILKMPYVPNARMDRVMSKEEVFTLKYFCNFINTLNFKEVIVSDVHSNVTSALINNVIHESIVEKIHSISKYISQENEETNIQSFVLFYPDEGAMKRYSEQIGIKDGKRFIKHLFGMKNRNWETGEIIDLNVFGDIPKESFNVLIVDDICSYGTTFLHSAIKLKEMGADKVFLYVTHLENSILDGKLINSGLIEKIFTTKTIFTEEHLMIEVLE